MLELGINLLFNIILIAALLFFCKKGKRIYVLLAIIITTLFIAAHFVNRIIDFNLSHNWEGKILSVIVLVLFILISKRYVKSISNEDYKISLGQKKCAKEAVFFCIAALVVLEIAGYLLFPDKEAFNIEVLMFQATMPGLSEELFHRGICLGLFNKAFTKRIKFMGVEFGWALIITSILFGLSHALYISTSVGFAFNYVPFLYTTIIGLVLGFLAEAAKKITLPIVFHNIYNVVASLMDMFM